VCKVSILSLPQNHLTCLSVLDVMLLAPEARLCKSC